MWALSPGVHHLNHGSFGAVPTEVRARQREWQRRWDANPTGFVFTDLVKGVNEARVALAAFLGADPAGLAPVVNASSGVAAVIRSIEPWLALGDEIVTTSQDYNAVRQTLEFSAGRHGARVRVVEIPFPVDSPSTVRDLILDSVTDRVRVVVVDHVTSPTALVFPVEEIVAALEPDVPVLVDGAHGPGQMELDLGSLGASWYTGNLHKWMCAPHGSAFLYTRADRIDETVPTVVSHAWNSPPPAGTSRYQGLFDWTGTDDLSPWLVIPDVIEIVGSLDPMGWPAIMERNHQLAIAARDVLCSALAVETPAPDSMIGSMAAIPLPDAKGADPGGQLSDLNGRLLDDGFETVVSLWPAWPHQVLRVSAHLYNSLDEYQALAHHLSMVVG
jgi:isopenicillin-N epimerase